MNEFQTKQAIDAALKDFGTKPVSDAAIVLLKALGYKSQKRFDFTPNTADNFRATFAKDGALNPQHALLRDWQTVDLLFQLADEEIRAAAAGNQPFLFESKSKWNGAEMSSF